MSKCSALNTLPHCIPENLLKTTRLELESSKKVLPFRYLQKITRTRTQNKLWAGCQFCGISETIHISSWASTLPCIYQVGTLHNVVNHSDYIHEFQISLYIHVLVPRLWFQMSLGFSYHCSHQPWQPSAMANLGIHFSHTITYLRWYQILKYIHTGYTITAHTVQLHLPYALNGGLELVSMDTFLPLGDCWMHIQPTQIKSAWVISQKHQ